MASSSSLLSEEQFLCSVCLDVFTDPVSIQCGHNFCMACIRKYWDSNDPCQCPMCKKTFDKRPDLFVNTFISEMAAQVRKSVEVKATSSPAPDTPVKPREVSCDFCPGTVKALKSCLVCQTSYCETHLEPHQRVAALKRHKLIDPVENLKDRMCKKHDRPLELFCRRDQTCVCQFCTETDHKTHDTVPIEEEYGERKAQLGKTEADVQQMIQERLQKVSEIKHSVDLSQKVAEREKADSVQVFTALVDSMKRGQAELLDVIEEKQKAAERRAEGLIKELEQEITELQKRSTELEQLSHTEDHLHLLQSFPSLSTPPHTKDWSEVSVHSDLYVGTVRRAVSQLEETLMSEVKKLCDAELKMIQQYAVDVTLDPDTAHPRFILSQDGKQVRRRPAPIFRPGQKVWLSTRDLPLRVESRKLAPRFVGPFKVVRRVNPVAYKLLLPPSMRVHPTFRVSLLKPFITCPLAPPPPPVPPPCIVDGQTVYTVRRVMNCRRRGRGFQFLVDWEGYGPEQRSWVPQRDILDPSLIEDYRRLHPEAPR